MMEKATALVTGASSGIGRALALALAEDGWKVVATARRLERLQELAAKNPNITPRVADFADPAQVHELAGELAAFDPPLTLLVNNAGYGMRGLLEENPLETVRALFEVNVFAVLVLCQAALPIMRARRSGTIVNLSSMVGKFVFPGSGVYGASKHALEAMSDALRHEAAPFGVKVIAIRPGPVTTEFQETATASTEQCPRGGPCNDDLRKVISENFGALFTTWPDIPGPELASEVIMKAIAEPEPKAGYPVGPVAVELLGKRKSLSEEEWRAFMDQTVGIKGLKL